MIKISVLLFALAIPGFIYGQSYSGPESIERNLPDGDYFVANTVSGQILKLNSSGTLSSFASGLSSGPHGLEVVGDTLYACSGSTLKLFNRNTGALINSISMGATFLNGITHKGHTLYITDFSAKKIYRLNTKTNQYNVFVTGLVKSPNGIIYDYLNDRAVFVSWGSSATIFELNLYDSTTTLLTTTSLSNIDGIAMNCQGEFFTASWSPSAAIKKWSSDFTTNVPVTVSGLSNPADIYFDSQRDTLLIPNSGNNSVSKVLSSSCILNTSSVDAENLIDVFPNPFHNELTISSSIGQRYELTNAIGKTVLNGVMDKSSKTIQTGHLERGIYILKISNEESVKSIKLLCN